MAELNIGSLAATISVEKEGSGRSGPIQRGIGAKRVGSFKR
jgi:hypothetical protein